MYLNKRFSLLLVMLSAVMLLNGCAVVIQKGRRSDLEKIASLEGQLDEMRNARTSLESSLRNQIDDAKVKLEMKEKGLVITVLAEVLYDSGKAKLRTDSKEILSQVSAILKKEVAGYKAGVEGHTDNVPIKYSKWSSNWELSAHRALSVLEFLIEDGVAAERLQLIGNGEFQPVVPNTSKKNRQLNRRVEIVVYPKKKLSKKDVSDFEEFFK